MTKGASLRLLSAVLFVFFLSDFCLLLAKPEDMPRGNLVGFVYDKDGTTPIAGAVVRLKNISTGTLYDSSRSDGLGSFKVEGLKSGIYAFGVLTFLGDFHSDYMLGIREAETSKVSISLNPYQQEVAQAVQEVYKEQKISGESIIGRVIKYMPETGKAEVFIEKGLLKSGDRIHIKGKQTDFYQEVQDLKVNGLSVKRVLAGESCSLGVIKLVEIGDQVCVTCKWGLLPLIPKPLGTAMIIAGTSAIIYGVVKLIEDEPTKSAYKK